MVFKDWRGKKSNIIIQVDRDECKAGTEFMETLQRGWDRRILIKEYVRNIGKLSSVQISRVLAMTDGEHIMTQKQIASQIASEMGVSYTQMGIHYMFKRLKIKNKTGRPSNVRKDEVGLENFKKKDRRDKRKICQKSHLLYR
jgi:transposase